MAVSDEEIAFLKDHFSGLGHITTRKMMGGLTIYANGQIFALRRSDGQLYIKAKGAFADEHGRWAITPCPARRWTTPTLRLHGAAARWPHLAESLCPGGRFC